jgi:hypothetical protein
MDKLTLCGAEQGGPTMLPVRHSSDDKSRILGKFIERVNLLTFKKHEFRQLYALWCQLQQDFSDSPNGAFLLYNNNWPHILSN